MQFGELVPARNKQIGSGTRMERNKLEPVPVGDKPGMSVAIYNKNQVLVVLVWIDQ